jgi:hypothetical protein
MQRKVAKRSKRGGVLRFILAKDDKEKIGGWKQDLVRILQVFNVRSIGSPGNRELSIHLSDPASDRYPHDGCRYPNSGCGYPNDGCRYPPKGIDRAGRCVRPKPFGMCDLLFINTQNTYHGLDRSQVSNAEYYWGLSSYVFIASLLVNRLPRLRGTVSDVTS